MAVGESQALACSPMAIWPSEKKDRNKAMAGPKAKACPAFHPSSIGGKHGKHGKHGKLRVVLVALWLGCLSKLKPMASRASSGSFEGLYTLSFSLGPPGPLLRVSEYLGTTRQGQWFAAKQAWDIMDFVGRGWLLGFPLVRQFQ